MHIPLSWLQEFIKISQSPTEIAEILTMLGLEVDGIDFVAPPFEKVVVAKVVSVEKHPNADNLCLAKVDDGTHIVDVVCGAPNCRAGMKTALAPVGAIFHEPDGKVFKVSRAKIRGVESMGMLCSAKELQLSDDDEGIIELPDAVVGTDLREIFKDVVFEISVTPNLGHCASVIGVVRELAAATGQVPYQKEKPALPEQADLPIDRAIQIKVDDPVLTPRYACRVIQGVRVGPSPQWLQRLLRLAGVRSINNIVDVTNYILLEMGQPMHAFDYDQIAGKQLVIRCAKEGEKLVTLDGKERSLSSDMLLICDEKKPLALAGIMGGKESEVGPNTVNILLESAYFEPKNIRKTSKKLALQTDSSWRFERGSDPNQVLAALDRAASLIVELAGGRVAAGVIDKKEREFPSKKIPCRVSRIKALLGCPLSLSEIETVFQRLRFPYQWQDQDTFIVEVPTYRVDIQAEIDLVEEVARIHGYDNITIESVRYESSHLPHVPMFLFEREIRSRMIAEGLQEFLNCDLVGPSQLNLLENSSYSDEAVIKVMNPASADRSILRPTLLPGLLEVVKYNYDHQNHDVSGFEIGRIHMKNGDLYKEQSIAGIILSGNHRPYHWDSKGQEIDFFDLKGIVENVLKELGVEENVHFQATTLDVFHSGRQAAILTGSHVLGHLGEIHPAIVRRLDVPQRIFYAELNLHDLIRERKKERKMHQLSLYPSSERDWTITLKEPTPIGEVFSAMRSIPSKLLEDVSLLDVYCSDRLGKERKNVTFHFVYRDHKKTISQEEVDTEHARLTQETLRLLGKAVI